MLRVMQVSQVQVAEETVVLPQFQVVEKIVVIPRKSLTCPLVCNDRCRGVQSDEN